MARILLRKLIITVTSYELIIDTGQSPSVVLIGDKRIKAWTVQDFKISRCQDVANSCFHQWLRETMLRQASYILNVVYL